MSTTDSPRGAVRALDNGLLRMHGPDAARFLQGYLTCDTARLDGAQWSYGALCTREGRTIATMRVSGNADDVRMHLPAALAPAVRDALAKFAVFAKSKLVDVTAQWAAAGLIGADAIACVASALSIDTTGVAGTRAPFDGGELLWRSAERAELWWVRDAACGGAIATALAALPELEPGAWVALDIAEGWPELDAARSARYLPQALSLDQIGAVSFTKGCYLGQEIVTRLQHRGESKQRLSRLRIAGVDALPSAAAVRRDGRDVGEVLNWAARDGALDALTVLDRAAAGAALTVDGRTASVGKLPYSESD